MDSINDDGILEILVLEAEEEENKGEKDKEKKKRSPVFLRKDLDASSA